MSKLLYYCRKLEFFHFVNPTAAHDCVVTGWGKTHENGLAADVLRKVVVPIIDKQACKQSYSVSTDLGRRWRRPYVILIAGI